MPSNDYLNDERKKLWKELVALRQLVEKKPSSEYEREIKQISKKCSEYRNRTKESEETAAGLLKKIEHSTVQLKQMEKSAGNLLAGISDAASIISDTSNRAEELRKKVDIVESLFVEKDDINEKIDLLVSLSQKGEDYASKIASAYSIAIKRKKEFDQLYYEIIGYDDDDESTGETVRVEGLKDELEKSYMETKKGLATLQEEINDLSREAEGNYDAFMVDKNTAVDEQVGLWDSEYSVLAKRIRELLPDALTAGLSSAFSEKRKAEIVEGKKLNSFFSYSIIGLIAASMLPFIVSFNLLLDGKALEDVILDMPRMVLAIMPLYFPLLWMAYSSNKKASLSKRLVEEYTHKEVLSKTFEGLSNQIEEIDDVRMSSELRVKLLFNMLDVSAENPGKLITDYNQSDHPLMDALDKSAKLSDAVEGLSKIPGLSKVTGMLERRTEKILSATEKKIEDGLEAIIPSSKNVKTEVEKDEEEE